MENNKEEKKRSGKRYCSVGLMNDLEATNGRLMQMINFFKILSSLSSPLSLSIVFFLYFSLSFYRFPFLFVRSITRTISRWP